MCLPTVQNFVKIGRAFSEIFGEIYCRIVPKVTISTLVISWNLNFVKSLLNVVRSLAFNVLNRFCDPSVHFGTSVHVPNEGAVASLAPNLVAMSSSLDGSEKGGGSSTYDQVSTVMKIMKIGPVDPEMIGLQEFFFII